MDDHFDRMLAPSMGSSSSSSSVRPFIEASKFEGRKLGYAFKMGHNGLGYYHDTKQNPSVDTDLSMENKKRKLDDISSTRLDQSDIDRLLEEADNDDIEMLTAITLKQLLLSFEKKINKNQSQRMKYVDQPDKFMESELDLHKEVNELYAVSASPDLYPILVEAGSMASILGMVAHDNTDISIAAIGLLLELMDPSTIEETDEAVCVVDAFLEGQGLELVVQNLSRLDESVDEDAQGVHDSMSIIENLVEIRTSLAVEVCQKTNLLKFLMMRLRAAQFDANKLYCSEILSILLQTDASNSKRLADVQGAGEDGIEMLLQIVYQYRKKDPEGADEKECVQNMFHCICTVLLDKENQVRFREKEGMELMVRYLKENKFAAAGAIRVISYATAGSKENCLRLLEINGMRFLFPLFMGRGYPHGIKKSEKKDIDECVISTMCQLCLQLHDCSTSHASQRLLSKFGENDSEKSDRAVELFSKYSRVLGQTEREMQQLEHVLTLRAASADPDEAEEAELELEMLNNDDARYLKRLDGGLHLLQQVAIVIAFACVYKNSDTIYISRLRNRLYGEGLTLSDVQNILREMAASIGDGHLSDGDSGDAQAQSLEKNDSSSSSGGVAAGLSTATKAQRQTLITWSACVSEVEKKFSDDAKASSSSSSSSS